MVQIICSISVARERRTYSECENVFRMRNAMCVQLSTLQTRLENTLVD